MDGTALDRLARLLATGSTRRTALRGAAGIAVAAGLSGQRSIYAQEATPTPESNSAATTDGMCGMLFEVVIRQGPSSGTRLRGVLTVGADEHGAVDGSLLLGSGLAIPVTGQVTGRAVSLHFDAGDYGALYGVGVIAGDLGTCEVVDMGGPVVGPRAGDSGDWAVLKKRLKPGETVCLLGDPFCGDEPVLPTDGGGSAENPFELPTGTCSEGALDSCQSTCMAANLSSDCGLYCTEALFCAA
ncbi:MAG: hypothetical protein IT336_06515 [Thermomicrobiales bacterium]|nr:hypothetical protein [Thermomicrobiales bacterium]